MGKKKNTEPEVDLLKPLDLSILGSNLDPCFGKGYDLTTDECKRCGDSELCAIKMANKLNGDRNNIESKQEFKDINDDVAITKFIKRRIKRGEKWKTIEKRLKKKFKNLHDTNEAKIIHKSLTK